MNRMAMDVVIVGSGFGGQETQRILEGNHVFVDEVIPISHDQLEGPIPSDVQRDIERSGAAILAMPHEEGGKIALKLRNMSKTVIDLSANYRLPTAELYREGYDEDHIAPDLLPLVPYGLPELTRKDLIGSKFIAVPGCYPTAFSLAIVPLVRSGMVAADNPIAIEAMSGWSGKGISAVEEGKQIELSGEIQPPYTTGRQHRHIGEMEMFLEGRQVDFTARVGPWFQGIIADIGVSVEDGVTPADVHDTLAAYYGGELLVEVLSFGEEPVLIDVMCTDKCRIGVHKELTEGGLVHITSTIDNLGKGMAGQGVQCLNLACGFPEYEGLRLEPDCSDNHDGVVI